MKSSTVSMVNPLDPSPPHCYDSDGASWCGLEGAGHTSDGRVSPGVVAV